MKKQILLEFLQLVMDIFPEIAATIIGIMIVFAILDQL